VPVNVRVAGLAEAAAPRGASVVDQQRQPLAEPGDVGTDPLGRIGVSEIGGDVARLARQRLGQCSQPVLAAGYEDQAGAGLARKPARRRLPDPAGGSCYQC